MKKFNNAVLTKSGCYTARPDILEENKHVVCEHVTDILRINIIVTCQHIFITLIENVCVYVCVLQYVFAVAV